MDALSFVLGAVVVGGIALARELLVDRRRWEREQRAYDRVTRAARRLIADEVDSARGHLAMMMRRGFWPVPDMVERGNFLPADEWDRNKDRLAEALEDEDTWVVLAGLYYSLRQLRARALLGERKGERLTEEERANLQLMHDQALVLERVLAEDVPLPDDWRAQLEEMREAGRLAVTDGLT